MNGTEGYDRMWEAKSERRECFMYATTTRPVTERRWNGNHPVDPNTQVVEIPPGTRVLVTMASRFGDVGIRSQRIVPASHGYDARVDPTDLIDWSDAP